MTASRSQRRNPARAHTLQELAERLGKIEKARRLLNINVTKPGINLAQAGLAPTGIAALDGLLPQGGFRDGTLIEWLADSAACGVDLLALVSARALLRDGRALVVLDRERTFYPPAAAAWGLALAQTIVVRPANPAEELWALEQCLQSAGVGVSLCRLERATSRVLRRLQLAAEKGGGLGFLLRPLSVLGQAVWSDVRLAVAAVESSSSNRRCRVELVRCRRGGGEKSVILELDDATGLVFEPSQLAPAARKSRAARA